MPAVAQQREGMRVAAKSAELPYLVSDAANEAEARAAVLADAPATLNGLPIDDIDIEEEPGTDLYRASVRYAEASGSAPASSGPTLTFRVAGGTTHTKQTLQTVRKYPTTSAPDMQGMIGVTQSGVEGVDIITPTYEFSETHEFAGAAVTNAYRGTLFTLTGCVNDAPFRGFAAGECLFMGASSTYNAAAETWSITFDFACRPNKTALPVGSFTIEKKGWEYAWTRNIEQVVGTGTNQVLTQVPQFVYVERVYESASFSALGIDGLDPL